MVHLHVRTAGDGEAPLTAAVAGGGVWLVKIDEAFDHAVRISRAVVSVHEVGFPEMARPLARWPYRRCLGSCVLAFGTIFDDETDGFFDPDPMKSLCDSRCGLVDAAMLLFMYLLRDLILPLWITHHLFVLQH